MVPKRLFQKIFFDAETQTTIDTKLWCGYKDIFLATPGK
jgi:hypothetical protein